MQKLILTGVLCLLVSGLQAQPWMTAHEGKESTKLQDIVNAHKAKPTGLEMEDEDEEGAGERKGFVKEGKDYHFDRWLWYMEQHTDQSGNIISPLKNYQEMLAYKAKRAADSKNFKVTNSASWSFVGPVTSPANGRGIGRIQKVSFHPTDSNTYWVGTAGGGAWKTTNNGSTWTCMTDGLPTLGVADVTINPLNPNVVYICTGDRDGNDNYSIGVLKSTNGGATWNPTAMPFTVMQNRETNALLMNPLDTSALTLATSVGIFKSYDAGASWLFKQSGSFKDLLYRPFDTSVMYATGNVSGGSAQVYRSNDGGSTWVQVSHVGGSPSRASIAVTPANRNMIKAIFAKSATNNYALEGIYSSSDTGITFTKVFDPVSCTLNLLSNSPSPSGSNCDGQGWYDLAFAISPIDSNKVVMGGVNTWYSSNGGANWTIANQWANYIPGVKVVHADKHYQVFHPLRPTVLFECNDGGIYYTIAPNSGVWTDITNGMGITQFYRIAVADHSTSVLGGAQDNGSKRIGVGTTSELTGGDGMNCEFDPISSSYYYTAIQYGTIYRNGTTNISSNIPGGQPTGDWLTPYTIYPRDGNRIIAGFDRLWLTTDQGNSWTAVSPAYSGKIKRVAFAPSSPTTYYMVVNGVVRVSLDNGTTWLPILGAPGGTISDIIVDKRDRQHFWLTHTGYGSAKVSEYDTLNGWQDISGTLPDVPANCITIDNFNGTKYIGTDIGVYYRDTTMSDWAPYTANLPAAHVTDLGINYTSGEIWASTYGRGIWKSAKYNFAAPNAVASIVPLAADVITISPNPTNGTFDIRTSNAALIGQQSNVNIIDMAGRTVWTSKGSFNAAGELHVNTAGLPLATYIVDVTAQNGVRAKAKMIVN